MAGKGKWGDGSSSIGGMEGMSKNQLYDTMSNMKALIEHNQEQARRILIQNPTLTRALFQAQIMLGMLQPPELVQNVQPAEAHRPHKLMRPDPRLSSQATEPLLSVGDSLPDTIASPTHIPFSSQQHQNRPAIILAPSGSAPTANPQSVHMPLPSSQNVLHPGGRPSGQSTQISVSQSSHVPDVPPFPVYSGARPHPLHQPQMSNTSSQLQQPLQTTTVPHLPLQSSLPQQSTTPSMQSFHHQLPPHMSSNLGFQHPGPPQMHHSQPMFHSGVRPPPMTGASFPQAQSALINQPPSQSLYQGGGSHMGGDFGTLAGNSMRVQRGRPSWMPGPLDNTTGSQHSGPPPFPSSKLNQMGPGNQPPRPAPLAPDLEKALLQQVMSLTQEQINHLPPEQRNQVLQLQQMLRQ